MGLALLVAATLRNDRTRPGTIQIDKTLGGRSTLKFGTVHTSWYPTVGESSSVLHQDTTTLLFSGSIDEVTRRVPGEYTGTGYVFADVAAVDWSQTFDRRITGGPVEWRDTAAGTIITELCAGLGAGEGIDTSLVAAGPTIPFFSVFYATFREAFDAVAELASMAWIVRPDKKLVFFVPAAYTAPANITIVNVTSIEARETREDYINTVVVQVSNSLRDLATKTFTGDGTTKTWELDYPANFVSKVRVDGVEKTLGIDGVDTGKDWYWQDGRLAVSQDDGAAASGVAAVIEVDYVGMESVVIGAANSGQVTARAAIEANTGKYERFLQSATPLTKADAQAKADAQIANSAALSTVVRYTTNDVKEPAAKGFEPGQTQTIACSLLGVSGTFLIRSVSMAAWPVPDNRTEQWTYTVEAIQGPVTGDYLAFFRALAGGGAGGGSLTGTSGATGSTGAAPGIHYLGGALSVTLLLEKGLTQEVLLNRATTDILTATFNGVSPTPGLQFTVIVTVDATAGRLLTWGADFVGTGGMSIESEAGSVNIFEFLVMRDGTFKRRNTPAIGVI